jgi:UDP-N-acetylmuramate dehydrogenase
MASSNLIAELKEFAEFVKVDEPLAPYTHLKLGGSTEALVQPRTVEELCAVVRRCTDKRIPLHVLGGGCHVLIKDEGVRGVVLRVKEPAFALIKIEGRQIQAGCGAAVSALISQSARHALAGLEGLVGTPGTVGGSLRHSAGERSAEIGQCLRGAQIVDNNGQVQSRDREDLVGGGDSTDDPVLLTAQFELDSDTPDAIVKRMRKAWIQRKRNQPLSFQASCRVFKNPRGLTAAALITQAGLAGTKVGGAEVSERDANYIVAHPGASSRDVLRLIDLIHSRVLERFNTDLALELAVW